jgi:hypothetical protein
VQLLYFQGCPNLAEARRSLTTALEAAGLPPDFEEVDVQAAQTPDPFRGWGSPTILVDGRDVAGAQRPDGASCRIYAGPDGSLRGSPSVEQIRAALEDRARGPL